MISGATCGSLPWPPTSTSHARSESQRRFAARRRAEIKARGGRSGCARPPPLLITHLRAAGIDDADLAAVAGHTVETMIGTYTHPLRRSHDRIRKVIG